MSDLPSEIRVTATAPKNFDLEEIIRQLGPQCGITIEIKNSTIHIGNLPVTSGHTMGDQIEQTIQGGIFFGPVAAKMEHCTNIIRQQANDQRKQLLTTLQNEAAAIIKQLPENKREEAVEDLKKLVESAIAKEPNRRWYECSAKGLLEASSFVKDFAGNIAGTIGQLGKLLWPDFDERSGDTKRDSH